MELCIEIRKQSPRERVMVDMSQETLAEKSMYKHIHRTC